MKVCSICHEEKPRTSEFFQPRKGGSKDGFTGRCRVCINKYRRTCKNAERHRRTDYARKYGLSLQQYDALFEAAGGKCRLCLHEGKKLVLDHCHKTGKVRGVICRQCNVCLGQVEDSTDTLKRMVEYLNE